MKPLILGPLIVGAALAGCGPRVDPQEMGEIQYQIPKIEGADKPYSMPWLDEAPQQLTEQPSPEKKPD